MFVNKICNSERFCNFLKVIHRKSFILIYLIYVMLKHAQSAKVPFVRLLRGHRHKY